MVDDSLHQRGTAVHDIGEIGPAVIGCLAASIQLSQVMAGGKCRSFMTDHDDTYLRVVDCRVQLALQCRHHGFGKRIAACRIVEHKPQDAVLQAGCKDWCCRFHFRRVCAHLNYPPPGLAGVNLTPPFFQHA